MKRILLIIFIFLKIEVSAQFFINNNALAINKGIITINNMDFENSGDFNNNGELDIKGNFTNNGLFSCNAVLPSIINLSLDWTNNLEFKAGKSKVIMKGSNQKFGGTSNTVFNILNLKGNLGEIKTMQNSIICSDTLSIGDIEFATNGNELKIMNGSIPVQRTSGYISTLSNSKVKMYFSSAYAGNIEVPLGFGISANQYKPIYLINPAKDSFDFTLNGNSPLNEGMNPLLLQDSLCSINQNYYFRIKTYGSSLFYGITKTAIENIYYKLAKWDGMQWQKISNSESTNSLSFANLSLNSQAIQSNKYISQAQEKPFINAGNDLYISIGMTDTIRTKGYIPLGSNIIWTPSSDLSCSDCPKPVFSMGTPGEYIINITNGTLNCSASDTIIISLTKNYKNLIPNAFSPNGDNLNETFGPILFRGDKLEMLKIFNKRWQLLYKGNANWDGKIDGEIAQEGVYYYQMEILNDETGKGDFKKIKFEGDFTLIK